jgi:hypothetical protein
MGARGPRGLFGANMDDAMEKAAHMPLTALCSQNLAATVSQLKVVVRPSPLRVGHANFTTLEEIPLGEEFLTGTFFLYEHPIIILFDSKALHDFLSLACAQKAGVTLYATQVPILLALPEAEWLLIRWPVKPHLSLLGECFQPPLSSWKARGLMSFLV